jgi:hypothetical protein
MKEHVIPGDRGYLSKCATGIIAFKTDAANALLNLGSTSNALLVLTVYCCECDQRQHYIQHTTYILFFITVTRIFLELLVL